MGPAASGSGVSSYFQHQKKHWTGRVAELDGSVVHVLLQTGACLTLIRAPPLQTCVQEQLFKKVQSYSHGTKLKVLILKLLLLSRLEGFTLTLVSCLLVCKGW